MSMMSPNPAPRTPTMPGGNQIAVYSTYAKAQKAVDTLSDEGFEVQTVTIVGHDLHMVERVTGRLTYPRVAFSGFASGAWFGLFVGLLLSFLPSDGNAIMLVPAIVIGGAFGLMFAIISYALQRGKRDFTSQSQIVAGKYVLLCAPETAGRARSILVEKNVGGDVLSERPQTVVSRPVDLSTPPQYGVRASTPPAQPGSSEQSSASSSPAGRPLTYGEALDAQRKAARQNAQQAPAPSSGATPDLSDDQSVPTAPAASPVIPTGEDAPSARSTGSAASDVPAVSRPELSNPDNPFSAPKDEKK